MSIYLRRGATGKLLIGIPFTPFFVAYLNKEFQIIRGNGSMENGTYHYITTDFPTFSSLKQAIEQVESEST